MWLAALALAPAVRRWWRQRMAAAPLTRGPTAARHWALGARFGGLLTGSQGQHCHDDVLGTEKHSAAGEHRHWPPARQIGHFPSEDRQLTAQGWQSEWPHASVT